MVIIYCNWGSILWSTEHRITYIFMSTLRTVHGVLERYVRRKRRKRCWQMLKQDQAHFSRFLILKPLTFPHLLTRWPTLCEAVVSTVWQFDNSLNSRYVNRSEAVLIESCFFCYCFYWVCFQREAEWFPFLSAHKKDQHSVLNTSLKPIFLY